LKIPITKVQKHALTINSYKTNVFSTKKLIFTVGRLRQHTRSLYRAETKWILYELIVNACLWTLGIGIFNCYHYPVELEKKLFRVQYRSNDSEYSFQTVIGDHYSMSIWWIRISTDKHDTLSVSGEQGVKIRKSENDREEKQTKSRQARVSAAVQIFLKMKLWKEMCIVNLNIRKYYIIG